MSDEKNFASDLPEPMQWPPLIYSAHVPWHIRLRDLLITALGWLLVVDLLEDIWVLITQWLHVNVFRRTVELEHMMATFWHNIHLFFYLSFAFAAVILLVGLSRQHALRKPLDAKSGKRKQPAVTGAVEQAVPRLIEAQFDSDGHLVSTRALDKA